MRAEVENKDAEQKHEQQTSVHPTGGSAQSTSAGGVPGKRGWGRSPECHPEGQRQAFQESCREREPGDVPGREPGRTGSGRAWPAATRRQRKGQRLGTARRAAARGEAGTGGIRGLCVACTGAQAHASRSPRAATGPRAVWKSWSPARRGRLSCRWDRLKTKRGVTEGGPAEALRSQQVRPPAFRNPGRSGG